MGFFFIETKKAGKSGKETKSPHRASILLFGAAIRDQCPAARFSIAKVSIFDVFFLTLVLAFTIIVATLKSGCLE